MATELGLAGAQGGAWRPGLRGAAEEDGRPCLRCLGHKVGSCRAAELR